MVRPARLLRFAALSALLVPVTQLAGGLQPLWAARSVETPQIPGFFGAGDTRPLIATPEPWDLYILGGATRDRVLVKHPVPDGLWGVGDRFLNGSGAGNQITHQEPVPLAVTQIPGFFGAGDPWRVGTTQEPWDLDPLKGKKQKAGLPLPAELGKADPLLPQTGVKQDGTAALLDVEGQLEDGDEVLPDDSLYDTYTFDGEAGQFIEIRLSSDAFDTYLILLGPDGEQVAENDDDGEGLNSIIYIQLPQTGRYSVIANAYDAAGRGRYRLTVAASSAEAYQQGQENARVNTEANRLYDQGLQQFNTSQYQSALESWQAALAIYRELGSREREGDTLNALGALFRITGQPQTAIDLHQQALEIAREIGDQADESRALGNLGIVYFSLSQYERAIDFHEQSLEIAREIDDRGGKSRALGNLGNIYLALGQYERAIDFYEQHLEIIRSMEDPAQEGLTFNNLGNIYLALGQYEQAIDLYEEALIIAREIGDQAEESRTLGNLGIVHHRLGHYEQSIEFLQQSLAITRKIGDRAGEGNAIGNLGNASFSLGQYEQAISFYTQQLTIAREIGNRADEGSALGNLGNAYDELARYEQAISFYTQQLTIAREIGNRAGEGNAIGNLGNASFSLGQYEQAISFYTQQLIITREIGDRAGEGRALSNLSNAYDNLGQKEQAIEFGEQALTIFREIGARASEGRVLVNLGETYRSLEQQEQAIEFHERGLTILREIGDRAGEGMALGNLGVAYSRLGQDDRALEQYGKAVALFDELDIRADEALFLGNIGILLNRQAQPELAIVFLKASVDIRESIRDEIRQLDRDLQQAFTDTIAADYRLLAELLLQADRVLEAQEILDLLKLQELEDYELRNVRGTEETEDGIAFWPAEQEILDRFYAVLDADTDLQTFFASGEITAQVAQLQRNARGQNLNPEQLAKLQDNLQQAGNAALLYPLILDDRLELVLVTTTGLTRRTVPLDRVELNRVIAAFRADITNRNRDPRPNGQQLYDWLIAPLVADLEAAGAETILYAADGQLRYIPLAALHDGDQWLTDRFTINHITAASLTDFSQAEAAPLSILAGAFPAQALVIDVAGEQRWFNGLPFAQQEVENLQTNLPGTVAFFSAGFNRQAIEPRLGNHTIIHLATHGTFRSGHPNDSFILLGDGDRITLFDLDQWDLPNASLVVLSACETAVSGPELGTGEEILGFGYQIQRTGARAAIASLWTVSDGGTQALMDAFYLALQNGYSAAEALQRSQQALIANDLQWVGGEGMVRAGARPILREDATLDPNVFPSYSHPYYWAPFILIGNGL